MKENEKQLNIEMDADLLKRIKLAAVDKGIPVKLWVIGACEHRLETTTKQQ